jgi:uncharacterized protein with HEPN domain
MIPQPDRVRLRHMLDAATKAVRFAEGRDREDIENDEEPLADALVRLVSVIGEAASRVSPATRSEIRTIPWPDMIGMRNRLVHDYFDINLGILWATIQDNLPSLIQSLDLVLAEDEQE